MPLKPYSTIHAMAEDEFVERRSRFIGSVAPVTTEQEAVEFHRSIRDKYKGANHHVFAFLLREGRSRFSDDGEPSGTAGKPMLDVIAGSGLCDIAVVVTRYFGGVLLGTGGLTHAYSKGASVAIAAATPRHLHPATPMKLCCDYSFYGKLCHIMPQYDIVVEQSDFAADITLDLWCKTELVTKFCGEITEHSGGKLFPECGQEEHLVFK